MKSYETKDRDFLCVASPGSGKTRFSIRTLHKFCQLKLAERIIVVVPTEHLKKQWAEDAFQFGIDLDPDFENGQKLYTSDFHGIVITYAALGTNPAIYKQLTKGKKTIVVLDEVHHLGSSLTWGNAAQTAFEEATFRLLLSGTPFRRDANPIPFVKYENGVSKADYTYNYESAIIDQVCRSVRFSALDGIFEWTSDGNHYKANFEDQLDDAQQSERIKTALNPGGDYLRHMIQEADNKLNEIRAGEHTDAGGLIFAIDQEHARNVATLVERITGELPVIAISNDTESSRHIKYFKNSVNKWIVAIKMISEGIDIPRLRVGAYATNVTSELFFRQMVGRFVRMLAHLQEAQEAHIYLPKDLRLLSFASEIEQERDHALDKATQGTQPPKGLPTLKEEKTEREYRAIKSQATEMTQLSLNLNDKVAGLFNLPANKVQTITDKMQRKEPEIPIFEQKIRLREEINKLGKEIARKRGNGTIDWNIAHTEYLKAGGKNIDQETLFELQKRRKHFERQLGDLQKK